MFRVTERLGCSLNECCKESLYLSFVPYHKKGANSLDCPLPASVQGQVGRGFEQPGLVEGVLAHGRCLELDDL